MNEKPKNMKLFRTIALTLVIAAGLLACNKDDGPTGVPLVAVDRQVFVTDPQFLDLNVIGGWEYVTGGSRGLLVYRRSVDEFIAYDRHCTYQPEGTCGTVEVDSTGVKAFDPCCDSEFLLFDGSVLKGPANFSLKQYQTSFDGIALRIFN